MQIRQLTIRHFRGIESLDWTPCISTICLIGSNDSTKTTVLEAIDYVLSPKWNIPFSDADFYQLDTSIPIEITVAVGELPNSLLSLQKFGGMLRGWHPNRGLVDEPSDETEEILSIKLSVNSTLEPLWEVICDRREPVRISASDREQFRVTRIGSYVDRELSWGRGTTLTRITGDSANSTINLAEAQRKARQAISGTPLEDLATTSKKVEDLAKPYGVRAKRGFKPAFDADILSINTGSLTLHDGEIPIRQSGLGSKRLIALAMQKSITQEGAILLVDEIEHGLEPYRLRQLVRLLRAGSKPSSDESQKSYVSQAFVTTHSPIAVVEFSAKELHVVRSEIGVTSIKQIPDDLQAVVRAMPEALLAPRVIVCEGKTEVGLLRALDTQWMADRNGMAYRGVSVVEGGGRTSAPQRAIDLKRLGYQVLLFADSDEPITPDRNKVEKEGVSVIQWDENMNTEGRIFRDLPAAVIVQILEEVIQSTTEDKTLESIGPLLNVSRLTLDKLKEMLNDRQKTNETRNAIARASGKQAWFKRTDLGELIGRHVSQSVAQIPNTNLAQKLRLIEQWVYSA
ncbi:MAG: AAA family ATPase [Anaerolinea sp.]|nr:AAA family ATPase [Anaerolinea sp.]